MARAPARAMRFTRTERAMHWVHAIGFFGMLFTGLVLYLPALAGVIGRRTLVKDIHIAVAIGWLAALALIVIAGNRRALARTWRDFESLDRDDRRWLLLRRSPQGRFNAGQKLHGVLQSAFAVLFTLSGVLLWLGERNTTFRLSGTVVLHDFLTLVATLFVIGHLYLALIHKSTRPALSGMVSGTVPLAWAARHHSKWNPDLERLPDQSEPPVPDIEQPKPF